MVMQAAVNFRVGGLKPGVANTAAAPPLASTDQDSNRQPKILQPCALPFDRRLCGSSMSPHCLEPSERKLLTPPPSKKCYPVLGDRGLRIKKSIGGWSYWAK